MQPYPSLAYRFELYSNMRYTTHMDTFMKADVFFFIASVATIILTILGAITLWHISRVAKNIHRASDTIQKNFSALVDHVFGLREYVGRFIELLIESFMNSKKKSSKK